MRGGYVKIKEQATARSVRYDLQIDAGAVRARKCSDECEQS